MKDFKLVHAYFVNKKLKELSEEEFMKKGDLKTKCSGIERKFNGIIQLKDVLPPLFYKYYVICCTNY